MVEMLHLHSFILITQPEVVAGRQQQEETERPPLVNKLEMAGMVAFLLYLGHLLLMLAVVVAVLIVQQP